MKKYFRTLLMTIKSYKSFFMDFILGLVSVPLQIFVVYLFWKSSLNNGSVDSFTTIAITKYFIFVNITKIAFTPATYVAYEVSEDIHTGNIVSSLVKPMSYSLYCFSKKFSEFILKYIISVGIIAPLFLLLDSTMSMRDVLLGSVLGLNGFVLLFLVQYTIGVCGFWLGKVLSLRDVVMDLCFLLGGQLLPISMFPKGLQIISQYIPIQYIYYAPAKFFSGNYNPTEAIEAIGMGLFWIALFAVAGLTAFHRGRKHFEPQGG